MNEQNQEPKKDSNDENVKHPVNSDQRNEGAWNGIVEGEGQDPENQGGSLASDGPVSQAEVGRGEDLTDTE